MEQLRERFAQLKERFDALSLRVRIGALAGVGVLVALGLLGYANYSEPTHGILFSNLSQQDAARIVERLQSLNTPYEIADGGSTITVPEESVHETRLTLANEGLPSGGGVGFEIFDTTRFGESDFSEQVQFRRALEGELSRTLGHIGGVTNARVHLVLPERSLFADDESSASASVALQLAPGWTLRPEQVVGVTHLVASSVPQLDPSNVTVVDGDGRPLSDPGSEDSESVAISDAEGLRSQIERSKQRAVQQLLDASLGPGAAVVRVNAEVSLSREEHLQETYDPERVATRSYELTEERDPEAAGGGQGVPGAASNLPGGEGAETPPSNAGVARREERRNYEVTKTVRRSVHPVGRVSRLTVAVVVDGLWSGEGEARAYEPRDDAEMARIRSLVATAAGISEERGDAITVECVPFAAHAEAEPEPFVDPIAPSMPMLPYVAWLVGIIVGLIVLFVVWRKIKKAQKARAELQRKIESGEISELPAPRDLMGLGRGQDPDEEEVPLDAYGESAEGMGDYEQLRQLALEVARRDPELAARVVRGWLTDDLGEVEQEEAA